ncbi:hypothetical protein GCM10010969_04620 [Saccharibacillus kuerlensis]|uniref:Uncharacterized protein n=1 Tax=Saccharibacillus kuerlensis TaxID=459527 RepID=A0ABQ2KW52_9BACL|nr:hypothetical protein GCM10010969_04620 [Saccharibacillus kuerlensis]
MSAYCRLLGYTGRAPYNIRHPHPKPFQFGYKKEEILFKTDELMDREDERNG